METLNEKKQLLASNQNIDHSQYSLNCRENNRISLLKVLRSFFGNLSRKSTPPVLRANDEFYYSFSRKSLTAQRRKTEKHHLSQDKPPSYEQESCDPNTVAVNSVNISYLLAASRKSIHKFKRKSLREKQFQFDNPCSPGMCKNEVPPIDLRESDKTKELEIIVDQLVSFLHYGKNGLTNFIGSNLHLETEKMLIQTKVKREVNQNTKKYINCQDVTELTISDVACHTNCKIKKNCTAYYVLILLHNNTIFTTEMSKPNTSGCIIFDDSYTYKSPDTSFDINGKLYSIEIKKPSSNKFMLFFTRKKTVVSYDLPMMKLVREISFTVQDAGYQEFSFQPTTKCKKKPYKMAACFKINKTLL
ncbi:uncharacterized protein LOC143201527 [Rhynchophorus ferrugineus]|uniref:uncharacterized protein LOC143201527 n=1 Tax=Rhynchophorus ferrugineus TaxID=354439 RepID=UPI003FCE938C